MRIFFKKDLKDDGERVKPHLDLKNITKKRKIINQMGTYQIVL